MYMKSTNGEIEVFLCPDDSASSESDLKPNTSRVDDRKYSLNVTIMIYFCIIFRLAQLVLYQLQVVNTTLMSLNLEWLQTLHAQLLIHMKTWYQFCLTQIK